jgi:hypothetical protein
MRAKWAAVARVLAYPASGGARVIDVRLPRRPAARGFGPGDEVGEAAASGTEMEAPVAEEETTTAATAATPATPAVEPAATGTATNPQP